MAEVFPGVKVPAQPKSCSIPEAIKISLALVRDAAQLVIAVELEFNRALVNISLVEDLAYCSSGHLSFFGIIFLVFFDVAFNALDQFI